MIIFLFIISRLGKISVYKKNPIYLMKIRSLSKQNNQMDNKENNEDDIENLDKDIKQLRGNIETISTRGNIDSTTVDKRQLQDNTTILPSNSDKLETISNILNSNQLENKTTAPPSNLELNTSSLDQWRNIITEDDNNKKGLSSLGDEESNTTQGPLQSKPLNTRRGSWRTLTTLKRSDWATFVTPLPSNHDNNLSLTNFKGNCDYDKEKMKKKKFMQCQWGYPKLESSLCSDGLEQNAQKEVECNKKSGCRWSWSKSDCVLSLTVDNLKHGECGTDVHCIKENNQNQRCFQSKCVDIICKGDSCSGCFDACTAGLCPQCGIETEQNDRLLGTCIISNSIGECVIDRCPHDYPWTTVGGLYCCKYNRDKGYKLLSSSNGRCPQEYRKLCPHISQKCGNYYDIDKTMTVYFSAIVDKAFEIRAMEHGVKDVRKYIKKCLTKVNEIFSTQMNLLLSLSELRVENGEKNGIYDEIKLPQAHSWIEDIPKIKYEGNILKRNKVFKCPTKYESRAEDCTGDTIRIRQCRSKTGGDVEMGNDLDERLNAFGAYVTDIIKKEDQKLPHHWILFTGCDFEDTNHKKILGKANVGSLCAEETESFSQDVSMISFQTLDKLWITIAHEFAHAIGGNHPSKDHEHWNAYKHCLDDKEAVKAEWGMLAWGDGKWLDEHQFHPMHEKKLCGNLHKLLQSGHRTMPSCMKLSVCSDSCTPEMLSNNICDYPCDNEDCNYDNAQCSCKQGSGCYKHMVNDGICDQECNNEECKNDGEDCLCENARNAFEVCKDDYSCYFKCIEDGDIMVFFIAGSPITLLIVLFTIVLGGCDCFCGESDEKDEISIFTTNKKQLKAINEKNTKLGDTLATFQDVYRPRRYKNNERTPSIDTANQTGINRHSKGSSLYHHNDFDTKVKRSTSKNIYNDRNYNTTRYIDDLHHQEYPTIDTHHKNYKDIYSKNNDYYIRNNDERYRLQNQKKYYDRKRSYSEDYHSPRYKQSYHHHRKGSFRDDLYNHRYHKSPSQQSLTSTSPSFITNPNINLNRILPHDVPSVQTLGSATPLNYHPGPRRLNSTLTLDESPVMKPYYPKATITINPNKKIFSPDHGSELSSPRILEAHYRRNTQQQNIFSPDHHSELSSPRIQENNRRNTQQRYDNTKLDSECIDDSFYGESELLKQLYFPSTTPIPKLDRGSDKSPSHYSDMSR